MDIAYHHGLVKGASRYDNKFTKQMKHIQTVKREKLNATLTDAKKGGQVCIIISKTKIHQTVLLPKKTL